MALDLAFRAVSRCKLLNHVLIPRHRRHRQTERERERETETEEDGDVAEVMRAVAEILRLSELQPERETTEKQYG